MLALTAPSRPSAWSERAPLQLIEAIRQQGSSVIATDGADKHFLLAEGVTTSDVQKHLQAGLNEMGLV